MKKEIYSVTFRLGQALVKASSPEKVINYATLEWGVSNGPFKVAPASEGDLAWVQSMNGMLHEVED